LIISLERGNKKRDEALYITQLSLKKGVFTFLITGSSPLKINFNKKITLGNAFNLVLIIVNEERVYIYKNTNTFFFLKKREAEEG